MKSNKKILFFLLLTEFVMFSSNAKEVKANPITLYLLTNFSNELAFNIVFETNSPL